MRYYVVADPHGFYDEMRLALEEKGFFTDEEPHKLIICGDLFDRGGQARELLDFVLELIEKDQIILIRGNHEDLMLDLLDRWSCESYLEENHHTNGTVSTVLQLTETDPVQLVWKPENVERSMKTNPLIKKIIPAMLDYYETSHFVFVHGWIPCTTIKLDYFRRDYVYIENWRNASSSQWDRARWENGMELAHYGIVEPGKTIVCGHWHCSFGHANYEGKGGEFDNNPDFTPYYGDGIIALDACTSFSRKVNCIVIQD